MKYKSGCIVCGKELVYSQETFPVKCQLCKKDFQTNVVCQDKHYICDSCHSKDGFSVIEDFCLESQETNPLEIALDLMEDWRISLHGPEHHFIVPASLLTAYYNFLGKENMKKRKLKVARERASTIQGGMCGYYGSCGAAIGAGIFAAIISDSNPLSKDSWGYSNRQTGMILSEIGEIGGPRCCKRNTYLSIIAASKFLHQEKGIKLFDYENYKPVCKYKAKNKECIKLDCPYFLNK